MDNLLRDFVINSRILYENSDFACGYLEAVILEMFKALPESEQAMYLNTISQQNEKIKKQAVYRALI